MLHLVKGRICRRELRRAILTVVNDAKALRPCGGAVSRFRPKSTLSSVSELPDRRFMQQGLVPKKERSMPSARELAESAFPGGLPQESSDASAARRRGHWEDWMVNLRGEDVWLASERNIGWYTGKPPLPGVCPGVSADGQIRSLPMPKLDSVTRKATMEYFDNSWTLMETLFAGLKGEEPFYRPPVHGLRHPQIFYYGHTPCLAINKLRVAGILEGPVNAYMESVMEVGVDEMLWDDMHKNDMVWPTVADVYEYRKEVYRIVANVIATHPLLEDNGGTNPVKIGWDHPLWALFLAFEHERIHLETSSVLFRETPLALVQIPAAWPALHPSARRSASSSHPQVGLDFPANAMVSVSGGSVELGKPREFPSHGWDNEYGHRTVEVPPFAASKHLITNGEFWQFVQAGGYRTQMYWSEDGWGWRKHRNMKWPFFWEPDGPQGSMLFKLRTVFEVIDMQWDYPVDVNYHEARAYCAWKSEKDGTAGTPEAYRVITEAEHHLIRPDTVQQSRVRQDPMSDRALRLGGDEFAATEDGGANLNLAYASQSPVNAMSASSSGHHDAMGNAWEWTEDHFNPLEGFEVHHVYDDFSAPCFDGRHHMIMGGSFMSTGDNGASVFSRFSFRPHFLQHSSFRLVSSATPAPARHITLVGPDATPSAAKPSTPGGGGKLTGFLGYETDDLVSQYLGLHFPASGIKDGLEPILVHQGAPSHALRFPQRVAQLLTNEIPLSVRSSGRVLDLGCATGGSSFELAAAGFREVVGIDFSKAFVDVAQRMQRGEEVRFRVPLEGALHAEVVACHEPNVDAAARARCSFKTGDACELLARVEELGKFDGAVLANLLCRLPEPLACLDGLEALINAEGVVVILTPFSWLEQFTSRSKWLGGFEDPVTGLPVHSKDRLRTEMTKRGFVQIREEQMPLVIREHQRKYQYIVSEATVWKKM